MSRCETLISVLRRAIDRIVKSELDHARRMADARMIEKKPQDPCGPADS